MSPISTGPFRVLEVRDYTVVIEDGDAKEIVSGDRVELTTNPLEYNYRSFKPNARSPEDSEGSLEGKSQVLNADATEVPEVVGRIKPAGIPERSEILEGLLELPMEEDDASPMVKAKLPNEEQSHRTLSRELSWGDTF